MISCFDAEAAEHLDPHRKRRKPLLERLEVLERQHRRRREHGHLFAVHHRLERGAHRHFGLAVADIAAQQAVHRRRRFHVALDVADGGGLIRRQIPLEGAFELLLPVRVRGKRVTRNGLARGVELEQLLRHVAHGFLDLGLRLLPGRAAQAIERRLRAAGVLLDQIEPFDRDEQLVFAVIAELEKLLHDVADAYGQLLEADELADAVVDVHDVVADLEVAQIREERRGQRSLPARRRATALFLEDVRLGIELQCRRRPAEAARQVALGDEHRTLDTFVGLTRGQRADLVVAQQFDRALGAAVRAGDEQDRFRRDRAPAARRRSSRGCGRGTPAPAVW